MNNKLFLLLFISFLSTIARSQNYNIANLVISYDSEIDTLFLSETQAVLQMFLEQIGDNEFVEQIEIIGSGMHRNISEERIFRFVDFLKQEGIDQNKIKTSTLFYDKEEVELIVETKTPKIEIAQNAKNEVSLPKIYCAGSTKQAQVFEIQPSLDVNVQGIEGTKLSIHRNDLMYENGASVEGIIKVELKEFYKPEDILLADLQTMDGDKILETGGMLNLKITAENEPLVLKEGKTAKIELPTTNAKAKTGMNLYLGTELENGAVDWKREMAENSSNLKSFQPSSYVKLKEIKVLDSITYKAAPSTNLKSNGYPLQKTSYINHTHTVEYFDLELPYIPTPPPIARKINWGGVWINIDRNFSIDIELPSIDPPPPPVTDILVQIPKIENEFFPRVALILKDRSVFLRGKFLPNHQDMNSLSFIFERVPLAQEVAIIAFLDTGQSILYASKDLKTERKTPNQRLEMKVLESGNLQGVLAELAN